MTTRPRLIRWALVAALAAGVAACGTTTRARLRA
jgi:hypothetical protein